MSFYTSLTGLNSASSQLGVTSNNIANVGTTGFKRSRADFGDIFATSPLQKASSTVGQGVSLKQVSQEFSQGNVSFSSNALDLAITGDGFFPLRSADGLQDIYTRNGSFMLNEQFNVVNSAGQRLMAATVDSTGSANVNERVVLTIPQKTSGEAQQTSLVELGLNFPADAQVIAAPFNRADSSTYNKSTAMTVYDNGGNGYLATIYYVKTANASQSSPTNKWQTHVFVGDEKVAASLVQATDAGGDKLFVNQYGQIKPFSEVKDELTTAKTQLISLDELTDKRTSVPAGLTSTEALDSRFDLTNGINPKTFTTASAGEGGLSESDAAANKEMLSHVFSLDIDNTGNPVKVDLSYLSEIDRVMTGTDIANELTNYLNRAFGDESFFNLSSANDQAFKLTTTRLTTLSGGVEIPENHEIQMDLSAYSDEEKKTLTTEQVVAAIQKGLDATDSLKVGGLLGNTVKVSYDYNTRQFKFNDGTAKITLAQGADGKNELFKLDTNAIPVNDSGAFPTQIIPNGDQIRSPDEQRYGIEVTYDAVNKKFNIKSGTTGDKSSIKLIVDDHDPATKTTYDSLGTKLFGFKNDTESGYLEVTTSNVALRGISSSPAKATGTAPTINLANKFAVNTVNNKFVVTVDGIKGEVFVPPRSDYSIESFTAALEKGINSLATNENGVSKTVNGVKVEFDPLKNHFVFTTGTATSSSFIKISGDAQWGLENVEAGRGNTATWVQPTQHKDLIAGQKVAKYIDSDGSETISADGFTNLPAWSPIFLDKGELTFDTGGKLVSPVGGTQLETVYLAGGKGALTINIDYSASTQYSSPFAVLSQSQDGAPEGDLVGVTIGNDGLVSASYSNGSQKSLAKILLTNFSSPTGLRQIGDSSFLASAASGKPILGTAGGAGFGTIRAGATERSNVDLTQELVDLITAQRNFQANAKAIETSTTMTQAIINIRG
jgi:flagellar hook-basal body protein